jgi:hypothetical protein
MVECYFMCQSDNGSITDSHPLRRWSSNYIRSLEGIKDPRAPQRLQSLFTAAGFVEIEHTMIPMPLCGWSNGMAKSSSTIKATLQVTGRFGSTTMLTFRRQQTQEPAESVTLIATTFSRPSAI